MPLPHSLRLAQLLPAIFQISAVAESIFGAVAMVGNPATDADSGPFVLAEVSTQLCKNMSAKF